MPEGNGHAGILRCPHYCEKKIFPAGLYLEGYSSNAANPYEQYQKWRPDPVLSWDIAGLVRGVPDTGSLTAPQLLSFHLLP